jgi:hypothetical protein
MHKYDVPTLLRSQCFCDPNGYWFIYWYYVGLSHFFILSELPNNDAHFKIGQK